VSRCVWRSETDGHGYAEISEVRRMATAAQTVGWPRNQSLKRNVLGACFSPVLYRQWLRHPDQTQRKCCKLGSKRLLKRGDLLCVDRTLRVKGQSVSGKPVMVRPAGMKCD
jgi:hypothetical protein